MTSVRERIEADGADADLGPEPPAATATADEVATAVRRAAAALPDEAAALAAWDDAGALHGPETLDAALADVAGLGPFAFLRGGTRRRLLRVARLALERTAQPGSFRLAAAFVGELGDAGDVAPLERAACHPGLELHCVTALANLRPWQARLALLRVLASKRGAGRVLVIDRLLPHAGEAAVRLALVRDALPGLSPDEARDVAPAIADLCRCADLADDASADAALRAAARAVLAAAGRSPSGR